MQHVRIKRADGTTIDKDMDGEEIVAWFKDNSKDGAVTTDITLFTEAAFDVTKQEDSVEWVMSDMSLDRDQERVDPQGADFKNFKRNPVVLWAHDYTRPAIGKIANPKIKDGKVTGKVEFDSKDNDEFAYMVGQKVKKGFISAGSIGFKPTKVEFVEEPKDSTRLVHRSWELMEFSICNVPSNPNAMAVRAEEDVDTKKVAELEAKVKELEDALAKEKAAHNVYAKLFEDKRETSAAPSSDTVPVTLDAMFDASESSGQKQTDKAFDLMFAK
jgi:HK97 family phage prohead protease